MHRLLHTTVAALLLAAATTAQSRMTHHVGAPVPGTSLKIRLTNPTTSSGNVYLMAASAHTDTEIQFPPATLIVGKFRLLVTQFTILFNGTLAAAPTEIPINLPNLAGLIGVQTDLQFVDGTPTGRIFLSDNDLVNTMTPGVGTTLIAQGGLANHVGWVFKQTKQPSVGEPTSLTTAAWHHEPMLGADLRGYGQGHRSELGSAHKQADVHLFKRDRPLRDQQDGSFGGIATQHGKRVRLMRSVATNTDSFLVEIDDSKGTAQQISGSLQQKHADAYGNYWYVTPDGLVSCGVADNANGGDTMVLARLDGKTWNVATGSSLPGSNTSTLLLGIAGASLFDRQTIVANEVLLQGGLSSGGSSIPAVLWAPLDGSATPKEATLPNLGTGSKPSAVRSISRRCSADLKTVAFVAYRTSTDNADVYVVRNITKSGITISNVSGFKSATKLEDWGADRSSAADFHGAISRDGAFVAFLSGDSSSAKPNALYAAPTDGTKAGSLTAIGGFPNGTRVMGNLHFAPLNGAKRPLLVFAGTAADRLDVYVVDDVTAATPAVTRLTNTNNDIDSPWSYESDNRRYLYFGRDSATASGTALNIVGIDLGVSPPKVFDVTGGEFSSGSSASLELSTLSYTNEWRLAPNSKNEMFFVGRPARTGAGSTTYFDANVWKFDFDNGGAAKSVTSYSGSAASLNSVVHIEYIRPLADGSVVYAASLGTPAAGPLHKQTVRWHKGDGTSAPIDLGKFATGSFVRRGVQVVESTRAVYWVQRGSPTSNAPTDEVAYMALLNNSMTGHPQQLTGLPLTGKGAAGNLIVVTASATK